MLANKNWQTFLAIAPFVSMILFFIGYGFFIYNILQNITQNADYKPDAIFVSNIIVIVVLAIIMSIVSLGSLIFYIFHAVKNPNLEQSNTLVVWIILFVLFHSLPILVYWIVEIKNKPEIQLKS